MKAKIIVAISALCVFAALIIGIISISIEQQQIPNGTTTSVQQMCIDEAEAVLQ